LKGAYSSDPKQALEYFHQAIKKDPNFAQPYLGVASLYMGLSVSNEVASQQAYTKAKEYARKALELDDSLADAHAALAKSLSVGDWDWSGAEVEFKRAFEVNANSAEAHVAYATDLLMFMGRTEEAIAEGKRCQELIPGDPWPYYALAFAHYFSRHYDEALAQLRAAEELRPECCREFRSLIRGWVYREKGMYKEAIVELQYTPPVWRLGHLGNAYARMGNKAEAQKAIQELLEFTKQGLGTWELALVYAGLGDKNHAFEWLGRAYMITIFTPR
jgi:tetratricopeptide (TPR) repeat protein